MSLKVDFAKPNRMASNLFTRDEMDYYNKFNRFGMLDLYNGLGRTREYIFFTKPDLQLLQNSGELNPELASDPFFIEARDRYPEVLKQLQIGLKGNTMPYIPLISNCVDSSLDLPSITAGEVENSSNIYGDTITYRWSSGSSSNDHEFSLEFTDSKYLELYMLFKVWDEYCGKKAKGGITTPEHYVMNKILHDQVSAYKIIVDEDGETIVFYAKLYGVYPKSVPREAFSSLSEEGQLKINVNFKSAFLDDMDPMIIEDFNYLADRYKPSGKTLPVYNFDSSSVNTEWGAIPYIVKAERGFGPGFRYKLKWRV